MNDMLADYRDWADEHLQQHVSFWRWKMAKNRKLHRIRTVHPVRVVCRPTVKKLAKSANSYAKIIENDNFLNTIGAR